MDSNEQVATREFSVRRVDQSRGTVVSDAVAVEEPLERRLVYWFKDALAVQSLGLTMRTPGNDRELMLGSLLSEGVIRNKADVLDVRHLGVAPSNEISAELAKHVDAEAWRLARATYVNSSCGVCGKRSLDAITRPSSSSPQAAMRIDAKVISKLPDTLLAHQHAFTRT